MNKDILRQWAHPVAAGLAVGVFTVVVGVCMGLAAIHLLPAHPPRDKCDGNAAGHAHASPRQSAPEVAVGR